MRLNAPRFFHEAARQVAERLLLPEDAERAVEAARQGKLAKLGQ
jgi:hypothetical protein